MMLSYPFYMFIVLHSFSKIAQVAAAAPPAYTATDLILLNCGASSNLKDIDWRTWDSDNVSSHLASATYTMRFSVSRVPYEVATFFRSPFTYTFPLQTAGTKFLRLHFHPTIYSGFNTSQSFFSVTANGFSLLSNFSAYLYSGTSSSSPFVKEFVINVDGSRSLDLTFQPNPNSFAFVNGIEIVSSPDGLYFQGKPLKFSRGLYDLSNNTALENLYRLNVGGARVEIENDSGSSRGMFRGWNPDDEYIAPFSSFGWTPHPEEVSINYTTTTPPYSAPAIVYTSGRIMNREEVKGLEWLFPVDAGFYYLLRLHFCEFLQEIRKQNERVFSIYINKEMVEIDTDVVMLAGGPEIPIFMDYIVWVPDMNGRRQMQDMHLSLFPLAKTNPKYLSALLNGLEIFKLNDTKGSLAAANRERVRSSPPPPGKKTSRASYIIYTVIGGAVALLAVVAVVILSFSYRRRKRKQRSRVSFPLESFRYFSLKEIKAATRKFDRNLIIGRGGFGDVYRGLINGGATTVAVKRLNPASKQGAQEFQTEIETLSKLRHLNLVSLLGYSDECGEMILVYDYVCRGTLRSHLYNSDNPPLTWKQRLRICLGAARGLDYLHTGTEHSVIHRDVKTTNILLDEKWAAKMSDFGLSKAGGPFDTHVSTAVKGSIGYIDPEYLNRRRLTEKSDVYSFGVVLFEVLCARPAVAPELPREEVNLGEWANLCFMEGRVEHIIDSSLEGQIGGECLSIFVETAAACLSDRGIDRPEMSVVAGRLESAVQLQEEEEIESGGGSLVGGDDSIAESLEYDSSDYEHV